MGSSFLGQPYAIQTALGSLLADAVKPRSRSEWEARFAHWQRPASETEEAKIDAARGRVMKALARSRFLTTRKWLIIPQGSYHNRTNVRQNSDVDLCVCLTDAIFWDVPSGWTWEQVKIELGFSDLDFTFADYKADIARCIIDEFGSSAVDIGSKAIHLHKDHETHVSVDVVPTFEYRVYTPPTSMLGGWTQQHTGVALNSSEDVRRTNFPVQHHENGLAKNARTGKRYKRVVRILKRLRNHIKDNSSVPDNIKTLASGAASYLIESLVYNCPDRVFNHPSIYDDVAEVLRYLEGCFGENSASLAVLGLHATGFKEVNGIKGLFRPDQSWSTTNAHAFIVGARAYMEV